ncbi:MAG: MBL fold metallo-hydrolase [Candidatus Thermoplasmatota archaeon]|nr:MBL fold metallo-hydrolase [Candidatus Thermoplasmatota archaeon]
MKIKILYDDAPGVKGMIPSHGFSCLIDKEVLFDAGWDSSILLKNALFAGIDLAGIKKMVISHAHWDHMGSLPALLPFDKRSDKTVYFPSATVNMRKELEKRANLITEKEPVAVTEDIYTTGLMGKDIEEQALVIKGRQGLVILTGCAHPGVAEIIERARKLFGDDIYALIGGLHDFRDLELLKDIKLIAPCHCTVEKERILKESKSLRCGVGTEIEV